MSAFVFTRASGTAATNATQTRSTATTAQSSSAADPHGAMSPESEPVGEPRSTCLRTSLISACGYVLVATAYIVASSALAARASLDIEQLRAIETLKGVAFVGLTGALVFAFVFFAQRRTERVARRLARCEHALSEAETRVYSGLLAASIAHDANNLLCALLAEFELVRDQALQPDEASRARNERCIERLVGLNRRLVESAARSYPHELESIDLEHSLRDCIATLRSHKALRRCDVRLRCDTGLVTRADPLLLLQIVANLLVNAGEALQGHGAIEIRVARRADEDVLEVHDDGPGVPVERRADLFRALASTKHGGSGLGLFSVSTCAQRMGAAVEVADSPLGGALFSVRLPRTPV